MKCSDFIITLGSLSDSIKIIQYELDQPNLSPTARKILDHNVASIYRYQTILVNIIQDINYLNMENNVAIAKDNDILKIQIQDDEYTLQVVFESNRLLDELCANKSYGDLIKKTRQTRRVIDELITTEADFIKACNVIGKAEKSIVNAIELYKNYLINSKQSDILMERYFESSKKALDAYNNVENCFMMKYKSAIESSKSLQNIINWLNDCLVSTDFANYFEENLKKMALSADMLSKLIQQIQKANSNNTLSLTLEQMKALSSALNEISKPFQRLPRYVLLVTEVQKSIQSLDKIFKQENKDHDNNCNKKSLYELLSDLIALVKIKTDDVNQLSTLRDYNENLIINAKLLLKQLKEFVDQKYNKSPAFFSTKEKLLKKQNKLEKDATNKLINFLDITLQTIEKPVADDPSKLETLENTAKLIQTEMRNDFAPVNKHLYDNYTVENKSKTIEELSPLGKILSAYFAKFRPLSADDKHFILEEFRMQNDLADSQNLFIRNANNVK